MNSQKDIYLPTDDELVGMGILAELGLPTDDELDNLPNFEDGHTDSFVGVETLAKLQEPEDGAWWGCAESYQASGRPSRTWAAWTPSADIRPDDDPDGQGTPYPFNGMGGQVVSGPHVSRQEAEGAVDGMIYEDSDGYLQWR